MAHTLHDADMNVAVRGKSAAGASVAIRGGGLYNRKASIVDLPGRVVEPVRRLLRKLVPATNPRDLSHPFSKGCATGRVLSFTKNKMDL